MNDTEGEVNLWREAWAGDVWVQSKTIRHQARVARQAFPDGVRGDLTVQAIEELLALSHTAVQRRAFGYRGPVDRWRGVSVQLAYESLHGARIFLVDLLPAKELDAWTPSALAGVGSCLPLGDIRRVRIEALLAEADDESKRAGLKQALDIYYTSSDQGHARLRGFRNMLWAVACLIAAFVAVMVTIVWRSPDAMPVCFTPTVTSAGTVGAKFFAGFAPVARTRRPERRKAPQRGGHNHRTWPSLRASASWAARLRPPSRSAGSAGHRPLTTSP